MSCYRQTEILEVLSKADGPLTAREIGRRLNLTFAEHEGPYREKEVTTRVSNKLYQLRSAGYVKSTDSYPRGWMLCIGAPEPVKWVMKPEDGRYKWCNIEYMGETKSLKEWCEVLGACYTTVTTRIYNGMAITDALEKSVKSKGTERHTIK